MNSMIPENHPEIIEIIPNLMTQKGMNLAYYHLIFTRTGIVFDFLHMTYQSWILHVKPYKNLDYENKSLEEILKRHPENFMISYDQIQKIKLKKRSWVYNGRVEIQMNTGKKLKFFSKESWNMQDSYTALIPGSLFGKATLEMA